MAKKKSHEKYIEEVALKNPNVDVVGTYINNKFPIEHRCKKHNIIWKALPVNILRGAGCNLCKGEKISASKTLSHEEYEQQIFDINPTIKLIGKYVSSGQKTEHMCLVCNNIWSPTPDNIKNGEGCPVCSRIRGSNKIRMKHDDYIQRLKTMNSSLEPIEDYIDSSTKIIHKCHVCKSIISLAPSGILSGKGCPVCSGRIVGSPPEYKNSIWASEYKEYFSKYLTEDQMKMYSPKSGKLLYLSCPDCGKYKYIKPIDLLTKGFSCVCMDGQSFANKFVYNVLSQLNLEVIPEYNAKWSNNRRYDDYVKSYNLIIENHGLQHYEECSLTQRTLSEEQENDAYKEKIAKENGIEYYVVLDCRISTANYIKKSIMCSILPSILHFEEDDIDWLKAFLYASTSLLKQAAELYNNGNKIKDIAQSLHVTRNTIRSWLNKASDIGMCQYYKHIPEKIYCIDMGEIFDDAKSANKKIGGCASVIHECCRINKDRELNNMRHAYRHPTTNISLRWLYLKDAIMRGFITENI